MFKTLVILSIGAILLSAAIDCNNPLLKRTEVVARFGGSANILSTAAVASADIPVCAFLKGKQTCVSTAGYTALAASFETAKEDLVAAGAAKNKARFGNLASQLDMDTDTCTENIVGLILVATASLGGDLGSGLGSVSGSASVTIDWASIQPQLKAALPQVKGSIQAEMGVDVDVSKVEAARANVTAAKAACAKHLMQLWLYATCEASDADYAAKVQGTTESPILKVKTGYCAEAAADCKAYITNMKLIGENSIWLSLCSLDIAQEAGELLFHTDYSASVGTRLNEISAGLSANASSNPLAQLMGDGEGPSPVGAKLNCNANSNANDCNFVCDAVVNATGYNANRFNDLDPSAARLLQSGSFQESNDAGVDSISTTMASEDTTVAQEAELGTGGSGGSNGLQLFVNLGLSLIAAVFFL
jgi:hypothetical protein